MIVTIFLTTLGADNGPFNLYSDLDSYFIPFELNVPKASFISGYVVDAPTGATKIRVHSEGCCYEYIDLTLPTAPLISFVQNYYPYGDTGTIINVVDQAILFKAFPPNFSGNRQGITNSVSVGSVSSIISTDDALYPGWTISTWKNQLFIKANTGITASYTYMELSVNGNVIGTYSDSSSYDLSPTSFTVLTSPSFSSTHHMALGDVITQTIKQKIISTITTTTSTTTTTTTAGPISGTGYSGGGTPWFMGLLIQPAPYPLPDYNTPAIACSVGFTTSTHPSIPDYTDFGYPFSGGVNPSRWVINSSDFNMFIGKQFWMNTPSDVRWNDTWWYTFTPYNNINIKYSVFLGPDETGYGLASHVLTYSIC